MKKEFSSEIQEKGSKHNPSECILSDIKEERVSESKSYIEKNIPKEIKQCEENKNFVFIETPKRKLENESSPDIHKNEKKYKASKRRHTFGESIEKSKRRITDSLLMKSTKDIISKAAISNIIDEQLKGILLKLNQDYSSAQSFALESQQNIEKLDKLVKIIKTNTLKPESIGPSKELYKIINSLLVPPITNVCIFNKIIHDDHTTSFDILMESSTISIVSAMKSRGYL